MTGMTGEGLLLRHEAYFMGESLAEAMTDKAVTDAQFKHAVDDMSAGEWANDDPGVLQAAQAARVSDVRVQSRLELVKQRNYLPYPNPDSTVIAIGSRVTLAIVGDDEPVTYDVTSRVITGMPRDEENGVELISAQSPLARVLLGKEVGESVTWRTPRSILEAMILGVDQQAQQAFYSQFMEVGDPR